MYIYIIYIHTYIYIYIYIYIYNIYIFMYVCVCNFVCLFLFKCHSLYINSTTTHKILLYFDCFTNLLLTDNETKSVKTI